MKIIRHIDEMRAQLETARRAGKKIGYVPTMGALHEGHLSLMRSCAASCGLSVISVFVNRIQFDDPADFRAYPQTFENDCAAAESAGIEIVFAPADDEMYRNQLTCITMNGMTDYLCGASRPGHFTGVFTVVTKFFNIIQPQCAFFGQKDIQQARCIEKMCADLNIPVRIEIMPIIREIDGLAMSSRNIRLSPLERRNATSLYRALGSVEALLRRGVTGRSELIASAIEVLTEAGARVDYAELADYETLSPAASITRDGRSIFAIAAFFGSTRLIDNMIISPEGCLYREAMPR